MVGPGKETQPHLSLQKIPPHLFYQREKWAVKSNLCVSVSAGKSAASLGGDPFSRLCYTVMAVYLPDIVESDSDTVYLLRLCLICHFSFRPWVSTAMISSISCDATIMLHLTYMDINMDPTGFLQGPPYRASNWLPSLVSSLLLSQHKSFPLSLLSLISSPLS